MRLHPDDLITSQRPPRNTITMGVRISTLEFAGDTNTQTIAIPETVMLASTLLCKLEIEFEVLWV